MFALSLIVILGLVGFLIEQARLVTARRQATHFARFAALSALDEWYKIPCASEATHAECMAARSTHVLTRVNELTGSNIILGSAVQQIELAEQGNEPTGAAILTPGRYETDEEACQTLDLSTPCFRTLDFEESPNAIEISGSLYNFVQTGIGGEILRNAIAPINVRGRAALVARRGYFLVDFSPTTTQATYPGWRNTQAPLPPGPICGQGHYFAYAMDPTTAPENFAPTPNVDHLTAGVLQFPRIDWLQSTFPERGVDCNNPLFSNTSAVNCTSPGQYASALNNGDICLCVGAKVDSTHCHSDYMYKRTLSDDAYSNPAFESPRYHPAPFDEGGAPNPLSVGNGQWFWVNGYEHTVEPLTTIFLGLKKALTLFQERSVLSDRAGLIFFNEELKWPRTFLLTNEFDHLQDFTDFATVPVAGNTEMIAPDITFDAGNNAIVSDTNIYGTRDRELLIRHGVVPSALNFSDYYQALQYASAQLALERASSSIPSSSFVVVIGDLMHNCLNCVEGYEDLYEFDETKVACGSNIQGIPPQPRCLQHFRWFSDGMKEIDQLIQRSFIPENVPVHVIGIGEHIGFHTLAKLNANDDYYTDFGYRKEFGELEEDDITRFFVRGCQGSGAEGSCTLAELESSFANASYSAPFFEGNVPWYSIALRTQGVWAPVQREKRFGNCEDSVYKDDQGAPRMHAPPGQREVTNPYCLTTQGMLVNSVAQIMSEKPLFVFD
jgi:hypothetical protein